MSIKSNLIRAGALAAVITAIATGTAFAAVATSSVYVHSGPGTGYGVLGRLYAGEYVAIADRAGSWCEVSGPGPDGWVRCAYLSAGGFRGPHRFHQRFYHHFYGNGPSVSLSLGFGMPRHRYLPPPPPPYGFPGHRSYPYPYPHAYPWWY